MLHLNSDKTHDSWLQMDSDSPLYWDAEGKPHSSEFSIGLKFDGCTYITRNWYSGDEVEPDTQHICDLDNLIALLIEARDKAKEHFGEHWP